MKFCSFRGALSFVEERTKKFSCSLNSFLYIYVALMSPGLPRIESNKIRSKNTIHMFS